MGEKTSHSFNTHISRKRLNRSLPADSPEYSRDYKLATTPKAKPNISEKVRVKSKNSYFSVDKHRRDLFNADSSPSYLLKNYSNENKKRDSAFQFESNLSQKKLSPSFRSINNYDAQRINTKKK